MLISPDEVAPSQSFLKPDTVSYIFKCIHEGTLDKLPPPPIVRKDYMGRLVAIDGHNLLAVMSFLGQNLEVHVANSLGDNTTETTEADKARNSDLRDRYETVLSEREKVAAQGLISFSDLIELYRPLFEEQSGA